MTQKGGGADSYLWVDFLEKCCCFIEVDIFKVNFNYSELDRTFLSFKLPKYRNNVAKRALCSDYKVGLDDVWEENKYFMF